MKYLNPPFSLVFILTILSTPFHAQTFLQCPGDSLQLERMEFEDNTFIRLHFKTFAAPSSVVEQTVTHTYAVGGDIIMETKQVENNLADFLLLSLAGSHEFKLSSTCPDGDMHEGATLYVAFTFEEDFNCPPITDLVINQFTNSFIAFSWADTSIHMAYEVGYQPGIEPETITGGLTAPMFEQTLSDAFVHTFTIVAFCDDPGPLRDIVQSPKVSFTVITIDDIKLLQEQRDSVLAGLPRALRVNTCCIPFSNTVNKTDILNNLDDYILNGLNCMVTPECIVDATKNVADDLTQLNVFPNPGHGTSWINYALLTSQHIRMDILNTNGQLVMPSVFEGFQISGLVQQKVTTQDLAAGVYFLRVQGEAFETFTKLIIQ